MRSNSSSSIKFQKDPSVKSTELQTTPFRELRLSRFGHKSAISSTIDDVGSARMKPGRGADFRLSLETLPPSLVANHQVGLGISGKSFRGLLEEQLKKCFLLPRPGSGSLDWKKCVFSSPGKRNLVTPVRIWAGLPPF